MKRTTASSTPPVITQPPPPAKPIGAEIIATAIQQIADGMTQINKTRLTRKALVVLIHSHSNVPKKTIDIVLNNLDGLSSIWLNPRT